MIIIIINIQETEMKEKENKLVASCLTVAASVVAISRQLATS